MLLFVSIGCLGGVPPAATTLSVHTDFSSTFFRTREIRSDRRDVGDVVLQADAAGSATLTLTHTASGSTSRSKFVSRSGEHEMERRKSELGWSATGRWTDTPTTRRFTFDECTRAGAPDTKGARFECPEIVLVCTPEPSFGPTATVCTLSETELLDTYAVDRISREPWLHRGDPRDVTSTPTGEKVLWLGTPRLVLSASRRNAGHATIRVE